MPIQFRCVHCRQLLGISNSRAGTQVDCPACGRSLKVPTESGGSATAASTSSAKVDAGLLGALSELASLTGGVPSGPFESRQTPAAKPKSSPAVPSSPASRKRDSLRIVPITTQHGTAENAPEATLLESPERVFEQLANLPPVPVDDSPLILTDVEPVEDEMPAEPAAANLRTAERTRITSADRLGPKKRRDEFSMAPELTDALAELAGSASSTFGQASSQGVPEKRAHLEDSLRRRSGPGPVVTFALVIVAFAAGWLADRFFIARGTSSESNELARKTDEPTDGTQQVVLKHAMTPAQGDASAVETISGRVTYTGSDGKEKPDASALALLLPTTNSSSLKLDAGPLRDLEQTPARMAIETALNVLGATAVRADDDGQFKLPRRLTDPATLIIISRHSARPEGESASAEALAALSMWLTSPTLLSGRLAVQTHPLSAVAKDTLVPPIKIHFAPSN